MPDIFFNSEIGAAKTPDIALASMVNATKCLVKLEKYSANFLAAESFSGIKTFPLFFTPSGSFAYLESVFSIADKADKGYLQYIVNKLLHCKPLTIEIESDWIVEELGTPSDLLHYAAIYDAMLLTFATDEVWKRDFFTFIGHDAVVPNVWGQVDISDLVKWIEKWSEMHDSYIDRFQRQCKATLCGSFLSNSDLADNEWSLVFDKFRIAEATGYKSDNDLIKKLGDTKIGALYEIVAGRVRFFFVYYKESVFIGGKYIKGKGDDRTAQNKEKELAIKRINAYCRNRV